MLRDPRAGALVDNFAAQWLQLRNLQRVTPDNDLFPEFDDNLRQSFRREVELLFGAVMREDRSVLDLLTADYTFVDERLARHYGIPNVYGSHFRRVAVSDEARKGLLGKGAILAVTSNADRTSPVVRGQVDSRQPAGHAAAGAARRRAAAHGVGRHRPAARRCAQQMAAHRANAVCASCHKLMDPIGLALENFDAVGRWRTRDAAGPIDATRRPAGRHARQRRGGTATGAAQAPRGVRRHDDGEAPDLRARARRRGARHADGSCASSVT